MGVLGLLRVLVSVDTVVVVVNGRPLTDGNATIFLPMVVVVVVVVVAV